MSTKFTTSYYTAQSDYKPVTLNHYEELVFQVDYCTFKYISGDSTGSNLNEITMITRSSALQSTGLRQVR